MHLVPGGFILLCFTLFLTIIQVLSLILKTALQVPLRSRPLGATTGRGGVADPDP
jgi:hypothetical protein